MFEPENLEQHMISEGMHAAWRQQVAPSTGLWQWDND